MRRALDQFGVVVEVAVPQGHPVPGDRGRTGDREGAVAPADHGDGPAHDGTTSSTP